MPDSELCFMSAVDLARAMRRGLVSAVEVMRAHLAQIERVNPRVNAVCTLVAEQALAQARAADEARARRARLGPLHGLPVGIKDARPTKGIRTTQGSPIYKDYVPDHDSIQVERLKAAGAIIVGKTNLPEFSTGGQTFNALFGVTRNPYDPERTCGGSSGGSGVGVACGMFPLGDGSDTGGSLRIPAGYNNVVGLRPSPGRVPVWPAALGWSTQHVQGPMARSVDDAALMLSVTAGPDPRSPIALPEPGTYFARPLERDFSRVRIAWSRNLGRYPVEPVVTQVLEAQRATFERLGCVVEEADPDLSEADEIFNVLRCDYAALTLHEDYRRHPDLIGAHLIPVIEQGLRQDALSVSKAESRRTALFLRFQAFMQRYEYLVLPVSPAPPFSVQEKYLTHIAGQKLDNLFTWCGLTYAISLAGHPAVSVPGGFTPEGLPVGLQIVGRHQQDLAVLQLAHAFEAATGFGQRHPPLAR
ncbi:MAG: amidase [Candidatus Lambdaproteobacteria bacterium]|nr:amidase [Candidatus Lambdaproteobacteria bacterium]